ncbi:MAG: Endolytic murein transglycosylase [Lachnoclostridium sp.]|jgi:UPF0755 protein
MKTMKKLIAYFLVLALAVPVVGKPVKVKAAEKKYSIVIGDQNGKYTYYDLNGGKDNEAGIEITDSGSIMVPLERLTALMPVLTYRTDANNKKYSVTNRNNGKRIVFTLGKKTLTYYAGAKAKGVKKNLPAKTYISQESSAVMVHMSALKWVMNKTSGVKSFNTAAMQSAGFDTYSYTGLIAYNPYQAITSIPKATGVNNLSTTVKVTIPEGYSVPQIFELLVKKGVCASEDFLYNAMNSIELPFNIPESEMRCFRLEGYLYPDTYEFYRLSKGTDVINRILKNTKSKLTAEYKQKAESLGFTMDEIITMASLIEKEAPDRDTMRKVSSVIHNRLAINMKLQLDATVYYVERYIKPNISGDINRYNSYYNTRKCSALPAGPICNPGKKAIEAALNPADTDYLYFYSDKAGNYYFSATYEEIKTYYEN